MLILLLLAAYPLAVLNLLSRQASIPFTKTDSENKLVFWLAGAVALAAALSLGAELLSLLGMLNRLGVTTFWILFDLILLFGLRQGAFARGLQHALALGESWRAWPWLDKLLSITLTVFMVALGSIGLLSPPNNVDSLLYHMSRVGHWLQQGSLVHYAASYHHQLWSPPFAEEAILQTVALVGSDRLANSIQWFALIGAAATAAGLAALLGLRRRGQILAVSIAVSAPMVVLQASSTQNDLVAAWWAMVTLYMLTLLVRYGLAMPGWLVLGGAVGLGMLTKVTFYPYMGLVILAAGIVAWRRGHPARKLLPRGALAVLLILIINSGFWLRNWQTYGSPLGSPEFIGSKVETRASVTAPIADVVQHVALNFATPSESANETLEAFVRSISSRLGEPAEDYEVLWSWNHEDSAGSPLHMGLAWGAILIGLILSMDENQSPRQYALFLLLAFIPFAWTVDYGVYRVRYHLTFLMLAAPLIAWVFTRWLSPRGQAAAVLIFVGLSLPWLLLNQTRPVLGWQPRTRTQSILRIPRRESLFANIPELRDPYTNAAALVRASGCNRVGLSLDSSDPEYALWWLLDAPRSGIQIEVVRPLSSLESLIKMDFEACAVICTNCGERTDFDGLVLAEDFGQPRVFLDFPLPDS